ncbi:phage holin family protein [Chlamydia vaughanii]|uniref:phage holin family protein n=1 Tax=Chlamydia vaughanii TaxID=3112552 RepID=UPI0032B247AC
MTVASVSNNTPVDVAVEQQYWRIVINSLREYAAAIASVALTLISIAIVIAVACGGTHPAVILVAVAGIAIAGVLGYFALSSLASREKSPIPELFLEEIKGEYGEVIYTFIVLEKLTIQELRSVMAWCASQYTSELKESARAKLEHYGLEKIKNVVDQQRPLYPFEDFLIRICPFYFVQRFIELGDPRVPAERDMTPVDYWTASLGFSESAYTVFDTRSWMFAKVVTKDEYLQLRRFMRNGTWEQAGELVLTIQRRMLKMLQKVNDTDLFEQNGDPSENIKDSGWFYRFLSHKISWKQVQLFQKVDIVSMGVLEGQSFDVYIEEVYPYLDEEDEESYDHSIALTCVSDLFDD